jgi:ferredoxin
MKNRIYFFTGTGNSLNAAKIIAAALPECELVAICKDTSFEVPKKLERLGFVFPNYAGGAPNIVKDFICKAKFPAQGDTYLFAIATYGGMAGNVIAHIGEQLRWWDWKLSYGAAIRSYPNAVAFYPMIRGVSFFTRMANRTAERIAKSIVAKRVVAIPALKKSAQKYHEDFMAQFTNGDSGFNVNGDCVSCGMCKAICPVNNISLDSRKPVFHYHCEGCMACIQHCPKRAINYQNNTQKRRRYIHSNVTAGEIIKLRRLCLEKEDITCDIPRHTPFSDRRSC